MALDDWDNRFINHNSNHIRHPVPAQAYLSRNANLNAPDAIEDISDHGALARVYPICVVEERFNQFGHVGHTTTACGLAIYRGGAFPPEYEGNSFVCEPLHSLIHRDVLRAQGVSFVASRGEQGVEFLASTDNWFRPVNLTVGPDGALYVADFYRAVIEHPFGIPVEIQKRLDFRAGDDKGRIYRVAQRGSPRRSPPALSRATSDELARHLENRNAWWRLAAQRLLVERRDQSVVPAIGAGFRKSTDPRGRAHALYTLDGLGALDASLVREALRDPDPHVREHALRLSEPRLASRGPDSLDLGVFALVDDPNPRVRLQLAFTLGELLRFRREATLSKLADLVVRDGAERWMRVAVISSVPGIEEELLASVRAAHPGFFGGPTPGAVALAKTIAETIGNRADRAQVAAFLTAVVGRDGQAPESPDLWQMNALNALGARLHDRQFDTSLAIRASSAGPALARWAAAAARTIGDDRQSSESRAQAIGLLAFAAADDAEGKSLRERLEAILEPRQAPEVQQAALRALSSRPGPDALDGSLARWKGLSTPVRNELITAILARPDRAARLLLAVKAGRIPASEIGPGDRDRLLRYPAAAVSDRARELFESPSANDRQRRANELALRVQSMKGDPDHGRQLFNTHCSSCHNRRTETEGILFMGEAGNLGPDLGGVRERPREALLSDILDPSRSVEPRYVSFVVATSDGQAISGMIASETTSRITLKDGKQEHTIERKDIVELKSTGLSVMPENFGEVLTPQDLVDLIDYLRLP
jgi:putative heme-binding domain-containing protein